MNLHTDDVGVEIFLLESNLFLTLQPLNKKVIFEKVNTHINYPVFGAFALYYYVMH